MTNNSQDDNTPARKTTRRAMGRPVVMTPEARREKILSALDLLFREVGLAGMTMTAIARRAGMSKQTLYDIFRDRDTLFEAYLEWRMSELDTPVGPADDGADFETRLRHLFRFDEPAEAWDLPIALLRLAIAEAPHHPRLARRCLDEGPRTKQARLRHELDLAVARNELAIGDTEKAAALLMDMVHLPIIEVLGSPQSRPSAEAWRERFDYGLHAFLHAAKAGAFRAESACATQ
ncbi:TetR/AcrR family transcriptional regulator [Oceanicola sp. 22II-s10i]|uniref:TetR/AcrR family transcriptional regulator n=1 Tax=Oceanicola sp. 22II-s10i TaxID=1317116 RepID=UPI0020CEA94F|nr:TetR/AcrR family transcriptional regulator [Oceanicola sp. 22II-s10i]